MSANFNAAFHRWFKKSAIVDAQGEPLVVYHGTSKKFTSFEEKGGHVSILFSVIEVKRRGFFFTPNKDFARQFITERTGYVLPCYLSIQKPADFATNPDFEGFLEELEEAGIRRRWIMTGEMWEKFDDDNGPFFVDALTKLGYDGAIIQEDNHKTKETELVYVAFKPTQVKLAFNNDGTWDSDDPNMYSNPRRRR